jgi:hypothetical protein
MTERMLVLAEGALGLGRAKGVSKDVLTRLRNPLETGEDWPDDFRAESGTWKGLLKRWRRRWLQSESASKKKLLSAGSLMEPCRRPRWQVAA